MRLGIVRFHVREVPFVFAQTTVLIFLVLVVTLYRAICESIENICNNIQHLYKSYKCNMYEYINILYKFMRSFDHSYIFI